MTYRSLLVHVDTDAACAARTQLAIKLAKQLDCHLVGVAPTGTVDLPATLGAAASLSEFASLAWDTLREQAASAAQAFREQCRAAGLASFEAVVAEDEKAPALVRHAHCSDLTILTQADPSAPGHRLAQGIVEGVVLHSARPTLVLPYAGRIAGTGSSVMIAWDDSREAARAVSDALPLLQNAKRVDIVAWQEGDDGEQALRPQLEALRRWLAWHGVQADVHVEASDIAIGEAMLSRAADMGADLVVMGAWGHARWTEQVLGGATRTLLASMTVPVLMSH
jgi:nucleotide-binding universal stress UspA family protein